MSFSPSFLPCGCRSALPWPPVSCCFMKSKAATWVLACSAKATLKLFMLFLILIYWAVNNWHSARIGLDYAFPSPSGTESWLFWSPRLLGVCAHFFAAMSLALASWGLSPAVDGSSSILERSDLLVFTAPAAVLLVTFAVWAIDVSFLSTQTEEAAPSKNCYLDHDDICGRCDRLSPWPLALQRHRCPKGFFPGRSGFRLPHWFSCSLSVGTADHSFHSL